MEEFSVWKHYKREDYLFNLVMFVILGILIGFLIGRLT